MAVYVYNCDIRDFDTAQILAQQCNCVTTTAKGLSALIAKRYPHGDFYTNNSSRKPGTIQVKGGKGKRWLCAMYAQINPGKPVRDEDSATIREGLFKTCLGKIAKIKGLKSISFPRKIGCGLAGGEWSTYRDMLDSFANEMKKAGVVVYVVSDEYPMCETMSTPVPPKVKVAKSVVTGGESFTYSDMNILEYTKKHYPKKWKTLFERLIEGGYLDEVSTFIQREIDAKKIIYPPLPLIYNIFHQLSLADIKVVIVGQDPYIQAGQATGIAFSLASGFPATPSIANIYAELTADGFTVEDRRGGDLTKWVKQGVFLVNTCLTVRQAESGSHLGPPSNKEKNKWWYFTSQVFNHLNYNSEKGLVIIMWGASAKNYSSLFDDNKHKKLTSPHPSPLSAHTGFFGSKPFSKCNTLLTQLGHTPVDWSL